MRIIYNTSFIVNSEIEETWITFIRLHYLSVLHKNNLCEDVIFTKVSIDQPEGKTYSIQIVFHSETQKNIFTEQWLPDIEEKLIAKFRNTYLCFSSTLTEI